MLVTEVPRSPYPMQLSFNIKFVMPSPPKGRLGDLDWTTSLYIVLYTSFQVRKTRLMEMEGY